MRQYGAERPKGGAPARRHGGSGQATSAERRVRDLQSSAGNAALAGAMDARTVQRHEAGATSGGEAAQSLPAPNPVIAALWDTAVQRPLHAAANAMSDERPGYRAAFDAAGQARDAVRSAIGPLPDGDPRIPKANYLVDDLNLVGTLLAPRADIPVAATDEQIASKLGGMEYDAQVIGESLGGNPAPRQEVNPELANQ